MLRINIFLALGYFLGGYLGTLLSIPPSHASPIWPAAGIALAGMVVYGRHVIPGIWLGALVTQVFAFLDASSTANIIFSLGIGVVASIAATAQAALGAWLSKRYVGLNNPLIDDGSILRFMALGGPVSCVVSATAGIMALYLKGVLNLESVPSSWMTWWIGDTVGVLIFTPILLCFTGVARELWRTRINSVALPLVILSLLVLVILHFGKWQEQARISAVFDEQSNLLHNALLNEFSHYAEINEQVKALFESSETVSAEEFKNFTQIVIRNHPDIQALEWIPRITADNRSFYEQILGSSFTINVYDGKQGFKPAPPRPEYFPIVYVEPFQKNKQAVGFDIASRPQSYPALQKARHTTQTTLSRMIRLVQDPERRPSVVFYSPVYQPLQPPRAPDQSTRQLRGFVANVIRVIDIVNVIKGKFGHLQLLIRITDVGDVLFDETVHAPTLAPDFPKQQKIVPMTVANRSWLLTYSAAPQFYIEQLTWNVWWLILGCFMFTGLTGVGLLMLTGRTLRTEDIVKVRTRELEQKIVERKQTEAALRDKEYILSESQRMAHVGSWKVDIVTGNLSWSEETYRIYGVTPETYEHSLESFYTLIHTDDRGIVQAWIKSCLAGEHPGELEFRTVRPDGKIRFLSGRGDLYYDTQNRPMQMVGIVQDISGRKVAEAKIHRQSQLYALLSETNQAIVRCTTEEELFQHICRDSVQTGGMKMVWIGLIDHDNHRIRPIARYGDGVVYPQPVEISLDPDSPIGRGPVGTAVRENRPVWCQDFLNDPCTSQWHERGIRWGWRASAALPIHTNGVVAGVFCLYAAYVDAFDEAVRDLLIDMALNISFALDNFDREAKRKQAEESLQKSEQFLRTIIETEPECVKVVDHEGKVLKMNIAGLNMLEADSLDAVNQHTLLNFIVPEYRDSFIALHNRAMSGKTGTLEFKIIGLRGARRWLEAHAAPLRDHTGKVTMLLDVTRDVTQRKQAEQALQKSENRLMLAIKGSSDAPWDWDLENNQMYYSPQWWRMLGYEPDELPGDAKLWLTLVHPDDIDTIQQNLREALESGQDTHSIELRLRHKDGHYVPILERSFITRNKDGKVMRVSGTNMDLTERLRTHNLEELRGFMFESLSSGMLLAEILKLIVLKLESFMPGALCSILLLDADGQRLRLGAAPSLPDFYNQAIDGMPIGADIGCCGNTAFTGKCTMTKDIASDPNWSAFKTLAEKAGLASSWSEPILGINNKVLGAFAIYQRVPGLPDDHDIKLIVTAANFTSIAIERKRTESQLKLAAQVFEHSREGFMITDAQCKIIRINHAFTLITGYSESEALGQNANLLSSGCHDQDFYHKMWESIHDQNYWQGEIWNRHKNGEVYPELLNISVVRDNAGNISEYVGVFADISQIKASEAQLEFLAHHDPLTSLPNRLRLFYRLEHAIDTAKREGKQLALLILDLDRFKDVNDSFGHSAGDQLLQLVANRLTTRLRNIDTVCRLGGDEFTVLLEDISQPEDAARIAHTIISDLSDPWTIPDSGKIFIGVSIGISLYPQHGNTPELLLQNADAALYKAKESGRNRFAYFSNEFTIAARRRIDLEMRLRRALVENELQVYYQPQIDIASGKIVGAEALVRWQDSLQGLIPPGHFIPMAEQTGLILAIGAWVLQETCRQGRQWIEDGLRPLSLAVNVSPNQLRHGDMSALVAKVLMETQFPAEYLELELTESGLMDLPTEVVSLLKNLRAQGVRLAIDDFGTGYSSLAYLKRFPLDVLKIDKSFIDDIPNQQDDMEIVAAIIAIGHTLGFKVLAEGVETQDQLTFLQEHGCDLYQGYLKSRPLPAEDFTALVRGANTH